MEEALPATPWPSGKGVLFAVTAHVADAHNERLTMLTLRSLRLFHPAADILVVDNASPSGTGGASYDSQPFFAKLNAVLPCGYTGCCEGEDRGVVLHGCHTSSSCECCGRVSVQRTHDVGARSKAVGSLREFGALAQAALNVHYAPAHDPHHIVLLQSTTGLKRPISFGALDEAACPFSFLHLPYSMTCCQSDSAADVRMRTARWGLSCSTEAFSRHGVPRSFTTSPANVLWTASSHGTVVMTRAVLARLAAMRLFSLDVLDAMGNGRWCWETSAGLTGAWLAQERRMGIGVASRANVSDFNSAGGSLDARCLHPVAYKLHGNNIERMRDLNPTLQHKFKVLGLRGGEAARRLVNETPAAPCHAADRSAHMPWRLALHPKQAWVSLSRQRCSPPVLMLTLRRPSGRPPLRTPTA